MISLQRPGEPLFERAYGLADRRWRIPNTPDTIFAAASGAKTFTALLVMSLVHDGTLALDTTARSLLGAELPEVADDVTVEQLLEMLIEMSTPAAGQIIRQRLPAALTATQPRRRRAQQQLPPAGHSRRRAYLASHPIDRRRAAPP